jgi:serine O-acetyltransferase
VLGSVRIGDNAKIGSGSVVVHDVPANATVVGNPGHPVLVDGQRVGIPDIDYTHLPDPMAEALKCLVDRIIALEQELDEINPERKSRRREKITRSQETLDRLLHFRDGGGI